ncbi:unnamed protein product [Nezara viridula]|uniref:Uncharacterized protein n=1 Tax=Nezara viridula TaxID=85310 RepID=A0A9P0GYS5_NEZVI|nr:unnamed protein product [Nezara viridula]
MDTRAITSVIRDSMIAIDIGGTMSDVRETLSRLHDEIEALEGCSVVWLREFAQEVLGSIHQRCWGQRGRSTTPPPVQPQPSTPPREEPVAGPSRAQDRPSLRFKTRTRSFRNILY